MGWTVFIPLRINYDRTLEDRSLLRTLNAEAPKRSKWFAVMTTLSFIRRSLMLMILSRWQRFGYACVNFGPPISMREYCREMRIDFSRMDRSTRFREIEKLADQLMITIKKLIPLLPVSLVAAVIKETGPQGVSAFEVQSRVNRLIEQYQSKGAPPYVATGNRVETILIALNMLKLRRLVVESDGLYKPVLEEYDILSYYANSIVHWKPDGQIW